MRNTTPAQIRALANKPHPLGTVVARCADGRPLAVADGKGNIIIRSPPRR